MYWVLKIWSLLIVIRYGGNFSARSASLSSAISGFIIFEIIYGDKQKLRIFAMLFITLTCLAKIVNIKII